MRLSNVDAVPVGVLLILVGFALVFVGFIVVVAGSLLSGDGVDAEAGGVVFIGPIPVVFGTSKGIVWIALSIAALMLAFYFVVYR